MNRRKDPTPAQKEAAEKRRLCREIAHINASIQAANDQLRNNPYKEDHAALRAQLVALRQDLLAANAELAQSEPQKAAPFTLIHETHLPPSELEAIVEYAEIKRGTEPKRDTRGYINRLTESVACCVGRCGLVPKHALPALNDKLASDFVTALGGHGNPPRWKCLPALGVQGIYKSRHGWVAWRIGAACNEYAARIGTVPADAPLRALTIRRP